jgi:hypothetical protein
MWAYKKRPAKAASLEAPIKGSAKKALNSKKAQTVKPKTEKSKASKDEEAK